MRLGKSPCGPHHVQVSVTGLHGSIRCFMHSRSVVDSPAHQHVLSTALARLCHEEHGWRLATRLALARWAGSQVPQLSPYAGRACCAGEAVHARRDRANRPFLALVASGGFIGAPRNCFVPSASDSPSCLPCQPGLVQQGSCVPSSAAFLAAGEYIRVCASGLRMRACWGCRCADHVSCTRK